MSKYWHNLIPPEHNGRFCPSGSVIICPFCGHVVEIGEKHICDACPDYKEIVFDAIGEAYSYDWLQKLLHGWSKSVATCCMIIDKCRKEERVSMYVLLTDVLSILEKYRDKESAESHAARMASRNFEYPDTYDDWADECTAATVERIIEDVNNLSKKEVPHAEGDANN